MMLNLPNLLTMARMGLLPCVIGLIWPGIESPIHGFWAAVAYALAGVLDVVDGAIARRTNQVTALGKFLDPLADKIFYLVTLVALLQLPGPWIPPWIVMLAISRELAITGLRGIAATEGIVIAAGEGGKVKTSFATIGTCTLLVHYPQLISFGFMSFYLDPYHLGVFLTEISLCFSLISAAGYVRNFMKALRAQNH